MSPEEEGGPGSRLGPSSVPRVAWGSNVVDVGAIAGIKQTEY